MNVQSNDVLNRWFEGSLHGGHSTFTELFAEKILDKEDLKQ